MNRSLTCAMFFTIAAAAVTAAWPAGPEVAVPPACQLEVGQSNPVLDRQGEISRYAAQPAECLQVTFMRCSAAADKDMLDFRSAVDCSLAYEALLKRVFGGDFNALLAWWRQGRGVAQR